MKLNRWSWGYVPVALVLGLIWFEFWRSGAYTPTAHPTTEPIEAAPTLPPMINNPDIVSPVPVGPGPVVTTGRGPNIVLTTSVAPKIPVIDDNFLNNPPPITVNISNVPLAGVVDSLRSSFNMPSYLQIDPNMAGMGGGLERLYNLQAKNVPFWDVIKSLQAQGNFGFYPAGNIGNGAQGLVLSTQYNPVYRFQTSGPAILYPMQISYSRSISGQGDIVERQPGYYSLTMGAAVDPRILVGRAGNIDITEAIDDTGRTIAVPNNGGSSGMTNSNFWNTSVSIPAALQEPRAHKINLKCLLHFGVQLPTGMATLEDASSKVGDTLTLGDRKFRVVRFEYQANTLYFQITSDDGVQTTLNGTVTDATGRAYTFSGPSNTTRSYSTSNFQAPYRLTLRDPNAVRELTFPFEFKDIPLP